MSFSDDELLNQILEKALSLPPQDRKAYLDEACNDDLKLLENIKQLIAGCEIDVPEMFLLPSPVGAQWIRNVYRKLKKKWQ